MPLYKYICSKCGEFEIVKSVNEDDPKQCINENCDGEVKRVWTGLGWTKCDGFFGKSK
jgi:putative FmdB family regulatory protein